MNRPSPLFNKDRNKKKEKKEEEFVPNGCWLVFPQFHP